MKHSERPNIVLFYPDELRYDALGCNGNSVIKTPNINRLAQEGTSCDDAFVSFPLCTPFRASLFTGKYSHNNGVCANHYPISTDHEFLAEILRREGYRTGYIGKWHLEGGPSPGFIPPGPRRLGFEELIGFNRGHYYMKSIYYRDTDQPFHNPRYEPDFQTEHLIQFMNKVHEEASHPFFGMICYGAPHFPFDMPDYYKNLYSPDELIIGRTCCNTAMQKAVNERSRELNLPQASGFWGMEDPGDFENEAYVRGFISAYYGMIANIDYNVGRILDWLDKKNLAKKTIVIFLSDHGDMLGEMGYRCGTKKNAHHQASHVPFIIRYPKSIQSNLCVKGFLDVSVDTMPTILDLLDIDIPEKIDGVSAADMLCGSGDSQRKLIFHEIDKELEGPERFPVPERGIRTKEWLFVCTPEETLMLYDLINDPEELNNLAGQASYKDVEQNLSRLLREEMERTGDDWTAEAIFPPKNFQTHEEKSRLQKQVLSQAIVEYE